MNPQTTKQLSIIAIVFLTLLASCGIPLVPNNKLAENAQLYGKMELITEITLTGISPFIPDNTKGPELDQTPVLIPAPDNPRQLGWILFPAARTASGQSIVSINRQDLGQGGCLFGYYVDPTKKKHIIDAASQFYSVSRLNIDLPPPGMPFSRINAFPLKEGINPNRLAITTQGSSSSPVFSPCLYIADLFKRGLTDLGTNTTGTDYFYPNFPVYAFYSGTNTQYFDSSGTINNYTPSTNFNAIGVKVGLAPTLDRTGIYIVESNYSVPNYYINCYSFYPALASDSISNSALTAIASGFSTTFDIKNHAYLSLDPSIPSYHLSTYNPSGSKNYQLTSVISASAKSVPIDYPIVRCLQDGTSLALVNNAWRKVSSFDSSTGLPSVLSPPIPTGSMIFDYDFTDGNGVKWMVFAETFVQPVAPGLFDDQKNKDNLVLRAWRIKQSDLIP